MQYSRLKAAGAVAIALGPLAFGVHMAAQSGANIPLSDRLVGGRSFEQPQPSAYPIEVPADLGVEVLPLLGNVYMVAGGPTNVVIQTGNDGVMVVDPGPASMGEKVVRVAGILSKKQINYVVNTTSEKDVFGANGIVSKAGQNPTVAPPNVAGPQGRQPDQFGILQAPGAGGGGGQPQRQQSAIILAHENLLNRMAAPTGSTPAEDGDLWPTNTFFTARKAMWFNDEAVEFIHEPAARTDGDIMVWFRHNDVIAAGPIVDAMAYPMFDAKRGGSIKGLLKGMNDIIDIAVPKFNQQGGTRIAPLHGRILNEADVVEYRDMNTIIRDRIQLGIDKGLTLAQIKAQGPTAEYDPLYSTPKWTGEMYIEAIYNDLKSAPAGKTSSR